MRTIWTKSVVILTGTLLGCVTAGALTETNPYEAIPGRNVFALKPAPVMTNTAVTTPNPAPGIELQGFSTILGRSQVLLKVKLAARPPEPAKDQSFVMDVGDREGDIEIVSMDAYAGTVSLKNQGNLVSLNLKDNAAKPSAGSPSLPSASPLPGIKPLPTPPNNGVNFPSQQSGAGTIPTRSLRTDAATNPQATAATTGGLNFSESQQIANQRTPEENAALRLANQVRREQSAAPGPLIRDPRLNKMLESPAR